MVAGFEQLPQPDSIQLEVDPGDGGAGRKTRAVECDQLPAVGQRPLGAPRHRAVRDRAVNEDETRHDRIVQSRRISLKQAAFDCHKLCYARRADGAEADPEPQPRGRRLGPDRLTAAVIVLCILIGWIFGSVAWGFLVGAILGLPFGVYMTYKRYGHAL